jgi:hypothetical protein
MDFRKRFAEGLVIVVTIAFLVGAGVVFIIKHIWR